MFGRGAGRHSLHGRLSIPSADHNSGQTVSIQVIPIIPGRLGGRRNQKNRADEMLVGSAMDLILGDWIETNWVRTTGGRRDYGPMLDGCLAKKSRGPRVV